MKYSRPLAGLAAAVTALFLIAKSDATAANILWVSDASPGSATGGVFAPAGSNYTDSAFVALLQNAGHNVARFNNADGQAVLLSDAEIAAINTNDLVIIGRASGSGAFQIGAGTAGGPGQGSNWNTRVTAPLICMSPYLVRTIAANRMGWFVGDVGPDDLPTRLVAPNATDPAVDYLFGGVPMIGNTTAEVFDELVDRNTSSILGAPVTGGRVLATATFPREDNAAIVTGNMIADWPAGTVVGGGSNVLAGYRMYLSGGSRESASAPNAIPFYTGRDNLTATGEDVFHRAVRLALNKGVPPASNPADPVAFIRHPASVTLGVRSSVTFTVSVTGAAPRTLQWQRDSGDGVTFTNIPDAATPFSTSSYTLTNIMGSDQDARFRVIATNPNNSVTSDAATLTVTPDGTAPVLLSAGSVDGTSIAVSFSEVLDNGNGAVTDSFSYLVNGAADNVSNATLQADGKTVVLSLLTPISGAFTVAIEANVSISDPSGNLLVTATSEVQARVLGLTLIPVGALNPATPTALSGAPNAVQISGGGLDLAPTIDTFAFAHRSVDGDFDARVRVVSLTSTERLESVAKAMLTARASTATNAPAINVFATMPGSGDNNIGASVRLLANGGTNALGPSFSPNGMPNTWLRITRRGTSFSTYRSADGTNWTGLGGISAAFPSPLLVGLGAASHRNGINITATFENFRVAPLTTLANARFVEGKFTADFPTWADTVYRIEYKNSLADAAWTMLSTATGTGSTVTFTDPAEFNPTGSRFYRLAIE